MPTTTDELDPRDKVLQAHVPAVMVPRYSNFPDLAEDGHRYLVASDGIWLEVRRPWLHLRWPLAESPILLPYGAVIDDMMDFSFPLNGLQFECFMRNFAEAAHAALPNECAAWFVWNAEIGKLEYRPLVAINAGPGGVTFHRPPLLDHEHLAVDLHSHGAMPPFFSAQDDIDDAGEVKLSIVIGNVGPGGELYRMRLCAHSLFIPFDDDPEEPA
jgi:PRTRC genetic system protein A